MLELLLHERQAAAAGVGVDVVLCRKCGAEYAFEVRRLAVSSAMTFAHLYDDQAAGARVEKRAEIAAQALVRSCVEVVPCPRCGHIQREMLLDWDRGQYARLLFGGTLAAVLGFAATAASVTVAIAASRSFTVFSAFGIAILTSVALLLAGCACIVYRHLLLRRARPVESPFAARDLIDQGFMPALVLSRVHGDVVEYASPAPVKRSVYRGRFFAPVLKQALPCCCYHCGQPLQPRAGLWLYRCSDCRDPKEPRRWLFAISLSIVAGVAFVLMALGLGLTLERCLRIGLLVLAGTLLVGYILALLTVKDVRVDWQNRLRGIITITPVSDRLLEQLRQSFENANYTVQLSRDERDARLKAARVKRDAPEILIRRSWWARLSRVFSMRVDGE